MFRFKKLYEYLGDKVWTKIVIQQLIEAYDITCENEFKETLDKKVGLNYRKFKHLLAVNKEGKFFIPIANGYTPKVQSRIYTADNSIANFIDEIDMEYLNQIELPKIQIEGSDFGFSIEAYHRKIPKKQRNILKNHIIGISDGYYVIDNQEKGKYRIFSVFTRLTEESRKHTTVPFNNDLSAGLQTLMMQFYQYRTDSTDEQLEEKYFLHFVLTHSAEDKQMMRKAFSEVQGETISQVKINLTKISYGGMKKEFNFAQSGHNKMGAYGDYYREEVRLRDFVLNEFDTLLDDKELREYYEAKFKEKKRGKRQIDNLKLYTFMEYYEKLIRDIMIELNPIVKYQHVHDSLWTSEEIDLEEVKSEVKNRLGFSVQF